jgi:hypothetical protein
MFEYFLLFCLGCIIGLLYEIKNLLKKAIKEE